MGKKILDIKVYVEDDYVYMSSEDWVKIVKVLGNMSSDWSVREDKEEGPKVFTGYNKVH